MHIPFNQQLARTLDTLYCPQTAVFQEGLRSRAAQGARPAIEMTGGHHCLWTMVFLLHELFCVTCTLHSNRWGEGTITLGFEGTIAQRCILYKGGALHVGQLLGLISHSTNRLHAPVAPFTVLRMQPFNHL